MVTIPKTEAPPKTRLVIKAEDVWRSTTLRVLDFDIESRPLGWISQDYVHQEPTAIASAWIVNGEPEDLQVFLLTRNQRSMTKMLKDFRARYDEADMVTGHYIRGYDLSQLNGALFEANLPHLGPKLSHDTKNDLVGFAGLSKSQENLAAMLGIEAPKVKMNVPAWREANRLTRKGLELTRSRVAGDVIQHIQMREELIKRGWLRPPRMWDPAK